MTTLTTQELGTLLKEMLKLATQEQAPTNSAAIDTRIGEIFVSLCQHSRNLGDE